MQKSKTVYFIEVKYRQAMDQGDGFEYITSKKLSRMNFAAQVWARQYSWAGDYRLMAAAVSGADCEDIQLIELE